MASLDAASCSLYNTPTSQGRDSLGLLSKAGVKLCRDKISDGLCSDSKSFK